MNRALGVVPGVPLKRSDDTNPFRERWRALFLLVVEPAALFEFAPQSFNRGCLIAVADDDHLPRLEVDFPSLNPVVDIALEDDLGPVLRSASISR